MCIRDSAMWADADEIDFKQKLGKLLKKKIYYKQNCLKTRDTLISKFSESSTYHLYDAFVDELG